MKCVFILSKHSFTIQYLSPAVVALGRDGMAIAGADSRELYSVCKQHPVEFKAGQTAVLLPKAMSPAERAELYQEFCAANPRICGPSRNEA
ncbi:hypothetical protein [Arenimonas sp. MALMAid1274]|uniref:hypothetical protein n=1 Tax=Arenimonas sp. MALMAid1274 TaxID=3411630 RepID=UPI003BA29B8A